MKTRKLNPEVDNKNWQILFDTQFENLQGKISKTWINGLTKLGLDNSKAPDPNYINEISKKYTGWKFLVKDEQYTDPIVWNEEIARRQMSLSNFIRTPEELFYCDQPDRWHDIIGHIPFLMDEEYSKVYQSIAQLYLDAYKKGGNKLRLQVGNLNWFVTEVGVIRENGKLKAFGATLYSSSGEIERAFSDEFQRDNFDLEAIINLPSYDRSNLQSRYFVIESLDQINEAVKIYREKYL